jgi:hypothetical protein
MSIEYQTTPEMRARCRELARTPNMDEYDRVVLAVLDDFEKLDAQHALSNGSWYRAAKTAIETGDMHALKCWCDASDGKI